MTNNVQGVNIKRAYILFNKFICKKGIVNVRNSEMANKIVLSITELMENKDFVLVMVKEYCNNNIEERIEKGIKDSSGDIKRFIPVK